MKSDDNGSLDSQNRTQVPEFSGARDKTPPADPPPAQGPRILPAASLPTGGGAIRGIGEKFSTNPATGTGSLSIPIATSPGRGGFDGNACFIL